MELLLNEISLRFKIRQLQTVKSSTSSRAEREGYLKTILREVILSPK